MLQPTNDGFQGEVLIVDDSFLDLRFLSEILNDHNYQVRRANCSATALRALDTWPPDIILLDINMPIMNGFEFLEAAHQEFGKAFNASVIVMLTTSLNPSDISRASEYDVIKSFVNKPLTKSHIKDACALVGRAH